MKTPKFKIHKDYKNCSAAALVSRAANVYRSMKDNTRFPAPVLDLEIMQQATTKLEESMIDAQHRDRLKSAQKNVLQVNLIGLLNQLADYVTEVADGDEVTLLSSGFQIVAVTSKEDAFEMVEDFNIEIGPGSGTVSVSVKRILEATSYTLLYGIDEGDKTVWMHFVRPKSKFVLKGLQPGKTYVFKMIISGRNDKEVVSEIITKIVA